MPPVTDHASEKEKLVQQAYRGQISQDQYRETLLRLVWHLTTG